MATILIISLPVAAALILWLVERRRLSKTSEIGPTCERCGYLLIGLVEPRCPECGEPFPKESVDSLVDELDNR
jgi:hypothetical protein